MGSLAMNVQLDGIDFTLYIASMKGHILQTKRHRCSLPEDEVLVKITHTDLSSSNVYHLTRNQTSGHTGVRIVQQVGSDVVDLKK